MGRYVLKIGERVYTTDVEGTDNWTQIIERDISDKLIRTKGNYDFKAWCSLYTFFYNHLISQGVCAPLIGTVHHDTECNGTFTKIWVGQILPQDWKFDLDKDVLEGQILENVWSAQFNNVNDQEIFISGVTTINGNTMSPIPSFPIEFFDQNQPLGTYLPSTRKVWRVYDLLTLLVSYYTDNTVTFESDFFDYGGDGDQYGITTGRELTNADGQSNPEFSWNDVFDQLDKLFNLWIIVEADLDNPVIRVEADPYVYRDEVILEISDPEAISMDIDLKQLYTAVKVGSSDQTEYDPEKGAGYLNSYYFAWGEETYNSSGCGFENNELNLQQDWRIDTNSINTQFPAYNPEEEQNWEDIYLVEIDWLTLRAFQFTNNQTAGNSGSGGGGLTPYRIYNANLTNNNVLERWREQIASFVFRDLSTNYLVEACCPNELAPLSFLGYFFPCREDLYYGNGFNFECIVKDFDGLYSQTLFDGDLRGIFSSPIESFYQITGSINMGVADLTVVGNITFAFSVYSDLNFDNKLAQYNGTTYYYGGGGVAEFWTAQMSLQNVFLPAGSIGCFEFYIDNDGGGGGAFATLGMNGGCVNFIGGQIPIEGGTDKPRIYKYDIARFRLGIDDFNLLKNNPYSKIRFKDSKRSRQWEVWISSLEFSHEQCTVLEGEFYGAPPIALPSCWVLEYEPNTFGRWEDPCFWIDSRRWIDTPLVP